MGLLNKTKCYLAGPIEFADGSVWRKGISARLKLMGVTVFNPFEKPFVNSVEESDEVRQKLFALRANGKLQEVHEHMKRVVSDDLAQCDWSNFVICYINPVVPTFGTMSELTYSNICKRPIYIVTEGGRNCTPLWILGMIKPEFIFDSFELLMSHLQKMDKGEVLFDSPRWKILKEEYK